MHPTLLSRPFHHEGWVYEEKIDGYRMVASKSDGVVRLSSRQGKDFTRRFPELVKTLDALKAKSFTLDGEVAVFDRALYLGLSGCVAALTMNPRRCPFISPSTC